MHFCDAPIRFGIKRKTLSVFISSQSILANGILELVAATNSIPLGFLRFRDGANRGFLRISD